MTRATRASSPLRLGPDEQQRLERSLRRAVGRARRSGAPVLGGISLELPAELGPAEVVCASRRPGEQWFVFEQPDRGAAALAGLGAAVVLEADGASRFREVAERWRELCAQAVVDAPAGPPGTGLIAFGGFAFSPDGARAPHWRGFPPASLVVPELAIARGSHGGRARVSLTATALACPDDLPEELVRRLSARVQELRVAPLPLLDPDPAGEFVLASAMPPEHYEHAVARAVELASERRLEKIVLAREVLVHAPAPYDPAAVFGVLRAEFPSCFCFCVGRGEATLVAASPELLLRREGHRVSTLALAGSTRRSADPAVDAHLGEQLLRDPSYREEHAIVARRIERTLRAHAIWVAAAPEPQLVRIANIQHLATPIRAQLARPLDALALAEAMHPTPAVGGEPLAQAAPLIP
ncbi:MAG TPA: chorismate-binding protein, partial [Solirubrobacteraceae bacterium]|nr:chorismate-binding protein [Solirubrobacteraceae bacterium]